LFRWDGRIRGGQLIVWSFGVGLLTTLASMALVFAFVPRDPVLGGWPADAKFWSVWSLGQLPGWVATASLMARRLHDLGKSATWLIPIFVYVAVPQLVVFMWPGINNTWMAVLLVVPMLIVTLWLIGAPGEKHDNRFGALTTKDTSATGEKPTR
jgi:uncharacterized membrane protein YhaH (DUF805 family)